MRRQNSAKHARVNGNGGYREPTAGEHLGDQSAGRMPHHDWLSLKPADHVGRVVGNLLQCLLGEDGRVARASSTVAGSSGQSGFSGA